MSEINDLNADLFQIVVNHKNLIVQMIHSVLLGNKMDVLKRNILFISTYNHINFFLAYIYFIQTILNQQSFLEQRSTE